MIDDTKKFLITDFDLYSNSSSPVSSASWVEQALDVETSEHDRLGVHHTRLYVGTIMNTHHKLSWFLGVILVGLFIIWARVFYLQIFHGEEYLRRAEGNRLRTLPVVAERGIIYDRFGKELVHNVPSFFLSIVPQGLPNEITQPQEREQLLNRLATIANVPISEINKRLDRARASTYQSLVIKENLDYTTALKLYLENNDFPGILIQTGSKRWDGPLPSSTTKVNSTIVPASTTYPASMSHVLGYMGKLSDDEWEDLKLKNYLQTDSLGKTGIEKWYEPYLRGTYGKKVIEVDALEREQSTLSLEPPIPGNNVYLTIDSEAQKVLEDALRKQLVLHKKTKGAAIALNPQNGEIYAMVSYPSFDSNDFSGGISQATYSNYLNNKDKPLFNRVVGGSYPPGSTLKPVVAAAALEEKVVTSQTSFNSTGGLRVNTWFFPDWKAGGHGITNVTKALAWSVNTFFYYAGGGFQDFKGLGARKVLDYLARFGLGKKTGIDLPGENAGFIPSSEWKERQKGESWYVGDTYNVSIGQGDILVSPLQVAEWTAIVANGGYIVQPHFLEKIVDPVSKKVTEATVVRASSTLVSAGTMATVRQGMRECVTYGSCHMLNSLPFTTGGKTGTAQWNKNKDTHAWFTAFAPFNNPQVEITVLVEEGGEGSIVSEPVAFDFLSWWGKRYLTP